MGPTSEKKVYFEGRAAGTRVSMTVEQPEATVPDTEVSAEAPARDTENVADVALETISINRGDGFQWTIKVPVQQEDDATKAATQAL